jgi:tRNA nucleotidyltransferase (CCA-adding enzyme)
LGRAALHTQRTDCRWAALLADLPEARAKDASERLKTPNAYSLLAARVSSGRPRIKAALKDGTECVKLLKALDALRREEPFEGFCETLVALEQNAVDAQKAIDLLQRARDAAQQVKAADFADQGVTGPELGAAIQAAQIERIASLIE